MNGNEATLKDYIAVVRKYARLILAGTVVGIVVAGAMSLIMPRTYRSSMILEVGKIYLPPRDQAKQEIEFIEEPDSTARVIESDANLDKIRQSLQLDIPIRKLRKRLEVETFVQTAAGSLKMESPLVKVQYEGNPPSEVVKILQTLAGIIVEQHQEKYKVNQNALGDRIENLQEKVVSLQKVIDRQINYRDQIQEYIDKAKVSADEFKEEVAQLETSQASAFDFLFLQSSSADQRRTVSDMSEIQTQLDIAIGENQEKVSDFKDEMVNIKNLMALSSPTRVRSPAVLPDHPVKPKKLLNIVVGGLLGLVFTTVVVFFREYLKD